LTKLILGNDAHYTLIGFQEMCVTTPKNPPVVEELPTFSIRDLVADDLIVKTTDEKKEKSIGESLDGRYDESEPLISLHEYLNGTVPHSGKVDVPATSQSKGFASTHSIDSSPNGVKPPRVKRRYFQHTVELAPTESEVISSAHDVPPSKDPQISSLETATTKYLPSQRRNSDNHVKSPPIEPELSSLPASSLGAVTPTRRKKSKKPKPENGGRKAFQSACAIDMDIMKYGGAIDDLTTAFAGAAVNTSKCGDQKRSGEGMHKKVNGAGGPNAESIELGMSN